MINYNEGYCFLLSMEMLFQVLFKIDNYNTHKCLSKLVQIFKYNFSVSMLGLYISTLSMSCLELCYPSFKGDSFFLLFWHHTIYMICPAQWNVSKGASCPSKYIFSLYGSALVFFILSHSWLSFLDCLRPEIK